MFNWICPRCGKDVPPSRTECPYCPAPGSEPVPAAEAAPVQAAPPAPPQQPHYAPPVAPPPPPQYAQQAPPQYAPPQYAPAAPPQHYAQAPWPPAGGRPGMPTWLMGLLFAIGFLALFGAAYYGIQRSRGGSADKGLENPSNASKQKLSNPLQKYIEVVGIRIVTEKKVTVAKFLIVNHSGVDIADLAADVTLWASTSRSEEDSVGAFSFRIGSIGPNEAKELSAPLKTKLRAFELPDWQNLTAEVQLTSP